MWWFVVGFVVALAIGYSKLPKQQAQPPAGLGDINLPTAEEGREIPVLFGTRDLNGPNIVWWGDFKSVAVKKKAGKK